MLERFARQYADHMKGNRVRLETVDSFHHPGMRAAAVAGSPMAIVEPSGAVDADPDANRMGLNEVAPSIVDEDAIGLKMMGDVDFQRTVAGDGGKRLLIPRRRDHQRLAGVPDDRKLPGREIRGEHLTRQRLQRTGRHHFLVVAIGKVAVRAIEVAKRRRLYDQQLEASAPVPRAASWRRRQHFCPCFLPS